MSELVSTNWLLKNLKNKELTVLDCSWHMPQAKRNSLKEYKTKHIPNAIFFDLDPEFVSFHHIIRLLMILFVVPIILKFVYKNKKPA